MHLYTIRHGQSYINLPDCVRKNANAPLTKLGQKQAAALAQWLPTNLSHVDAIYCSSMRRAVSTAQPLARHYGVTAQMDHRLREIGCNRADQQPWSDDDLPEYAADYWSSERPFASVTPNVANGESLMQFRARVGAFIEQLVVQHRDEIVLAVCHSRVMELIFDHIFNIGPWRRCEIAVHNTAITYFEYVDFPSRETWRLHYHNRVDHLEQIGASC